MQSETEPSKRGKSEINVHPGGLRPFCHEGSHDRPHLLKVGKKVYFEE